MSYFPQTFTEILSYFANRHCGKTLEKKSHLKWSTTFLNQRYIKYRKSFESCPLEGNIGSHYGRTALLRKSRCKIENTKLQM